MRSCWLFTCLLGLLLTACEDDSDSAAPCDDGVRVGQLIDLPDRTSVRVEEVIDTRCPCDVQCVRAGELLVVLSYGELRDSVGLPMNRTSTDGTEETVLDPFVAGDYQIVFTDIDDGLECRSASDRAEQEDYCLRFEVR